MKKRVIKFRAFDILNKNMFEIFDNTTQVNWFLPNVKDDYIIMQYTGLIDSNSKEIFEGDILEILDNELKDIKFFKVFFENGSFVCYHKLGFWGVLSRLFILKVNFKVIGNIYENTELI